jgi:hypothetical protein
MMTDAKRDRVHMGLAEAVLDVVDVLRNQPASGSNGTDNWERIVSIIAEHNSLPDSEVNIIEKAIEQAYGSWSGRPAPVDLV